MIGFWEDKIALISILKLLSSPPPRYQILFGDETCKFIKTSRFTQTENITSIYTNFLLVSFVARCLIAINNCFNLNLHRHPIQLNFSRILVDIKPWIKLSKLLCEDRKYYTAVNSNILTVLWKKISLSWLSANGIPLPPQVSWNL